MEQVKFILLGHGVRIRLIKWGIKRLDFAFQSEEQDNKQPDNIRAGCREPTRGVHIVPIEHKLRGEGGADGLSVLELVGGQTRSEEKEMIFYLF